jgi:hypothetical protein
MGVIPLACGFRSRPSSAQAGVLGGFRTVAAFKEEERGPEEDQPDAHLRGVVTGLLVEAVVEFVCLARDAVKLKGDLFAGVILILERRNRRGGNVFRLRSAGTK